LDDSQILSHLVLYVSIKYNSSQMFTIFKFFLKPRPFQCLFLINQTLSNILLFSFSCIPSQNQTWSTFLFYFLSRTNPHNPKPWFVYCILFLVNIIFFNCWYGKFKLFYGITREWLPFTYTNTRTCFNHNILEGKSGVERKNQ